MDAAAETRCETAMIRPRRSALSMPANNARAVAKSRTLPCDVVLIDLEDAVAPDAKIEARAAACAALREGGFGRREVIVRINALDSPWGTDDMAAVAAAGPDGIAIPKVGSAGDVLAAAHARDAAGSAPLWAMVETPAAVLNAGAIAGAGGGLAGLMVGINDLAKETLARLEPGRAAFLPWLALFVAAARTHGLAILDGVFNALDDEPGLREECEQGRALGMDGKTLIHPAQIAAANFAFAPGAAEIAAAQEIVAAFDAPEARGRGAIRLDGRMVERLHLEAARRTLAIAELVEERR